MKNSYIDIWPFWHDSLYKMNKNFFERLKNLVWRIVSCICLQGVCYPIKRLYNYYIENRPLMFWTVAVKT